MCNVGRDTDVASRCRVKKARGMAVFRGAAGVGGAYGGRREPRMLMYGDLV